MLAGLVYQKKTTAKWQNQWFYLLGKICCFPPFLFLEFFFVCVFSSGLIACLCFVELLWSGREASMGSLDETRNTSKQSLGANAM